MKKLLSLSICLVALLIGINVKADTVSIDVYVSNSEGAEVYDNDTIKSIPYNTKLKTLDSYESDRIYVEYEGNTVLVNQSDLKAVDKEFKSEDGFELTSERTIKPMKNAGLKMYKGPSEVFYDEISVTVPKDTAVSFSIVNSTETNYWAYVTYQDKSGWIYVDITNNEAKEKESGRVMVINSSNITATDESGNIVTIPDQTVLEYSFTSAGGFSTLYTGKELWVTVGADAIAYEVNTSIKVQADDVIYANYDSGEAVHKFTADEEINADMYYNGYYRVSYNGKMGWIRPINAPLSEPVNKNISMHAPSSEPATPIEEPVVVDKKTDDKEYRKPSTVEIVIAIVLAVILLLSITSLITLILINKKNSTVIDNRVLEKPKDEE